MRTLETYNFAGKPRKRNLSGTRHLQRRGGAFQGRGYVPDWMALTAQAFVPSQ